MDTKKKVGAILFAIAWLCIAAIIAIILVFPDSFKGGNAGNNSANIQATSGSQIQYEKVNLQVMLDELETNALRAEETYQDMYVEITGEIISFDSDGKYISIVPCGGSVLSSWVQCYIDQSHKAFLLEKNVGDVVTIRGKVFSIGEIIGYKIDTIEISD